jgi:transcriptional regulator GlxA family with amidase domain
VHWEHLNVFREDFTDVRISGALYEIDRDRLTSSGGTSSLDMMLQPISVQHGYPLAVKVSEQFIHERIREPQDEQQGISGIAKDQDVECLAHMPVVIHPFRQHIGPVVVSMIGSEQITLQTQPSVVYS